MSKTYLPKLEDSYCTNPLKNEQVISRGMRPAHILLIRVTQMPHIKGMYATETPLRVLIEAVPLIPDVSTVYIGSPFMLHSCTNTGFKSK